MRASNQIIGIDISTVNIKQRVAIFNGVKILELFHVGASPNKECLFVFGIGFELERTHVDKVIDVNLITIKVRSVGFLWVLDD